MNTEHNNLINRRRSCPWRVAVGFAVFCCSGGLIFSATVFQSDFQGSLVQSNTTEVNLNHGTAIGSWTLVQSSNVNAYGDSAATARALCPDGGYSFTANCTTAVRVDADTVVTFKLARGRSGSPGTGKTFWIRGLDASGVASFDLQVFANQDQAAGTNGALYWNNAGNYTNSFGTNVSGAGDVPQINISSNGYNPAGMATIQINFRVNGWIVSFDKNGDGLFEWTSDLLPFNGPPNGLAKIAFTGGAGAGNWFDDVVVSGTPLVAVKDISPARSGDSLILNWYRQRDLAATYTLQSSQTLSVPWTPLNGSEVVLSDDDNNTLLQTIIPITATNLFFRLQATAPANGTLTPQPPNLIEGIKLKTVEADLGGTNIQFNTGAAAGANPSNPISYAEAIVGLSNNGIHSAVLRYVDVNNLPAGVTTAQRDAEVIALLQAVKSVDPNFRVYLWQRQWMQSGGSSNGGVGEFISEMSGIINQARAAGVDGVLAGILPIETNLETSTQVLQDALQIVQGINANTANWLRNKSFFMPGAGMGAYFAGITTAYPSFFSQMSSQVKYFAFIFKFMKSQETNACALGAFNDAWTANLASSVPVSTQVAWLRSTMGLADLENYISANRTAFPNLCHVLYWGDSGDGFIVMNRKNIQAVHQLLVESNGWTGAFFDMGFCASAATGNDLTKYILTVNPTTRVISKNTAPNDKGTMSVWDEWQRWNWFSPGY